MAAAFLLLAPLPARPADGAGDVAAGTYSAAAAIASDGEPNPFVPNLSGSVPGARTNIVTSLADSGPGSLRQVVADSSGGDVVTFDPLLAGGTITLVSGPILIAKDLAVTRLVGAGVTVSGNNIFRVFEIAAGVTAILEGLTIADGRASGDPAMGGGVLNSGTLTLRRMTFSNNAAVGGYAYGGGLYNGGSVTVDGCTFRNNAAIGGGGDFGCDGCGGAVYDAVNRNLVAYDSTFSGNSAQGGTGDMMAGNGMGGAICDGNAMPDSGTKVLSNCTISGNTVSGDIARGGGCLMTHQAVYNHVTIVGNSASEGGGVYSANSSNPSIINPVLRNCILANNTASYGPDLSNAFESGGFNLIKNTANWIQSGVMAGNLYGADPLLGPLADNGGPTFTCLPQAGSPAVDAISPTSDSTAADQRGVLRPQGAAVDIGSVEAETRLAVIPNAGPFAGGNTVTITNGNFGAITNVLVGGVPAAILGCGAQWVTIKIPAVGAAGLKDIVVQTAGNGDVTLVSAYTVCAPASALPLGCVVYDDSWLWNGAPLRWRIVHTNYGGMTASVTLSATNMIASRALIDGGWNNRWKDATLRTYLNGSNFYGVFSAAFTGIVQKTAVPWAIANPANEPHAGAVTDAVFIASRTELGGPALAGDGAVFAWYADANTVTNRRRAVGSTGGASWYWTRTGDRASYSGTWYDMTAWLVKTGDGSLVCGNWTYDPFGAVPVINIQGSAQFAEQSDGTYRLVAPMEQSITFAASPAVPYGAGTLHLAASASSGLPVSLSVLSGPAILTAETELTFTGVGDVTVVATQAGNSYWTPAASVTNVIKIYQLSASAGPFVGGNTVTISNGYFGAITNVLVGGVASAIQGSGPDWVTIRLPATGSEGVKDIVLQTADQGDIRLPAAYTVNPAGQIWDNGLKRGGPYISGGMGYHSLAMKTDGSVVAWGSNDYGQTTVPSPNANFAAVSAGWNCSFGLKSDGTILAWGENNMGQALVPSPNAGFVAVSGGGFHTLGLKSDGTAVAWGNNGSGQTVVPSPNAGFVAVSAGMDYSLGLKSDGSVVAWGSDTYHQTEVPLPNAGFVAVSAGGFHALGLKADGSIVAWGYDLFGQTTVPAPNTGFVAVSAGLYHSLGLKSDGTIVQWGYMWGPVPEPNAGFVAVAAGREHSQALKADGSIVAWGTNYNGETAVPVPNVEFGMFACGVAPKAGLWTGGHPVSISGTNLCNGALADVTRVTLCGVDATVLGVSASTQVVVTAGVGTPGVGDVRVFSASHGETVKAGAFEYLRVSQVPLSFEPVSPQAYGTTNFLAVSGGSGTGAVSYVVLGGPGVVADGTNLAVTAGSGTVQVCATKAGDALYFPVAVTSVVAAVQRAQAIDFPPVADQLATNVVPLGATASSGLAVTFSVASGPASLNGNVLRFTGDGTVSVVASQPGDANWAAAPETTNSFEVARAGATVTLTNLFQTYDGTPRAVTATTAPAGLAVSIFYGGRQSLGVVGSGDAPVPAGRYAVTGTVIDDFYSGTATGTLVVAKADQTIAFPPIAPQAVTSVVALAATGGASGTPVTFGVVSGPGVIDGASLSFSAAGEVAVVAGQAGTENYNAAPDVTNVVSVFGVVTSVTPQHGVKAGGDEVRIDGLWLGDGTNITSVTLCGVEATIVSQAVHAVWVLSGATNITADLTGPVHVVSGFGDAALQDAFTYHVLAPPTALPATQISPAAFKAHWSLVPEADHYVIDVSATSNFTDFVSGYSNQFVGSADNAWANGLADGTWYWYRLRACTSNDVQSLNSNVIGVPTGGTVPWVAVSNMTGTASSGGAQEFPLNLIFAGAGLSFSATSDAPAVVTALIDAGTGVLRLTYPGASGTATVTVTAAHLETGYQVSYSFAVTIIGAPAYGVGVLKSSSMEVYQIVTVTNTANVSAEGVMVTVGALDDTAYVLNRTSVNGRGEAVIEYPHSLVPGASAAIKVVYARAYGAQVLQGRPATVAAHLVLAPLREAPPSEAVASAVVGAWRRADGCMVIAFRTVPGAEYMIQYRDSMSEAWKNVYPAVTASGPITYWVDSGLPVTKAHPKDVPARFYQILSYPNN